MKILIDTNIYLDFYRSNNEALKLFEEMEKHFDKIILTDQIIVEFERSRETVIKKVMQSFESESTLQNFSSSFLQNLPEFRDLLVLQKQYMEQRKVVRNIILETVESQANDPVAAFFNHFVNESYKNETIYATTDRIISKAHKRKLIGNPPTTADKYSIGDEINWEIILENVKEDIIIVGRDNTYQNNFTFLQKDFHRHTGRFIFKVTDRITEAFKAVGIETSEALDNAENKMIEEIQHYNNYWKNPSKSE